MGFGSGSLLEGYVDDWRFSLDPTCAGIVSGPVRSGPSIDLVLLYAQLLRKVQFSEKIIGIDT